MLKNKIILGTLVGATFFVNSVFAMQDTAMMKDDKMMMDKMATGTMMKDKMMDKMDDKMMMVKEEKTKMMMAITKSSPRSEVAKLQQHLIDEGFLKIPKWVKLGYYGPLTRAAYAKYEAKMKMMKQ